MKNPLTVIAELPAQLPRSLVTCCTPFLLIFVVLDKQLRGKKIMIIH